MVYDDSLIYRYETYCEALGNCTCIALSPCYVQICFISTACFFFAYLKSILPFASISQISDPTIFHT